MNMRRRPSRSPVRPPSSRKPPNAIVYAVMIHWRSFSATLSAVLIDVDDRDVENGHEHRDADECERLPTAGIRRVKC
jgi:hypothetical protein